MFLLTVKNGRGSKRRSFAIKMFTDRKWGIFFISSTRRVNVLDAGDTMFCYEAMNE